jgi:predicted transcriptional regulator
MQNIKLKDSIGSRRIISIYNLLDGYVHHEEICVKLDIKTDNLKYFLKKMVKMGIISVSHGRSDSGKFTRSTVEKHLYPYIE